MDQQSNSQSTISANNEAHPHRHLQQSEENLKSDLLHDRAPTPPFKQSNPSYWFIHSRRGFDYHDEIAKYQPFSKTIAVDRFDVCVVGGG